jgi:AcrR family transcriptional regulator
MKMSSKNEHHKSELSDISSRIAFIGNALMLKQGYEETTIRQICREAGIAIGTFYTYFSTKSDLLKSLYEVSDSYFTPMHSIDFSERTATSLYEEFIEKYIKLVLDSGLDKLKLLSNVHNKFSLQKREPYNVLLKIVEHGKKKREFRDDYTSADMLDFIFYALHGITKMYCVTDGAFDIASKMRLSSKLALDSIRNKDYNEPDK